MLLISYGLLNADKAASAKENETYFTTLMPWIVSGGNENTSFPLYKPYSLTIDKDGNVYVLDIGNSCVVKYDKDGRFIKSWGHEGQGPGELGVSLRSMIRFDKNENLAIMERQSNQRITFFDKDGKYLNSFRTEKTAYSISFDSKNNVYISMAGSSNNDNLIIEYDHDGKVLDKFSKVFIEDRGEDYHISYLVHDSNDNLYQIFTRFPYIRKYDSKNNLLFQKEINLEGYFSTEQLKIWRNYDFSTPSNKEGKSWILFCTRALFASNTIHLLNPGSIMKISLDGKYISEKVFEIGTHLKLGLLSDLAIAPNGDIYTTFIGDEKVGIGVFIY